MKNPKQKAFEIYCKHYRIHLIEEMYYSERKHDYVMTHNLTVLNSDNEISENIMSSEIIKDAEYWIEVQKELHDLDPSWEEMKEFI